MFFARCFLRHAAGGKLFLATNALWNDAVSLQPHSAAIVATERFVVRRSCLALESRKDMR